MATAATPSPAPPESAAPEQPSPEPKGGKWTPIPPAFLKEVDDFCADCMRRYRFNSRWDNTLNIFGIALSVGIIASGVFKISALAAILGGGVAAIVTAQKAFPFNQRGSFYRNLIGQAQNLSMEAKNNAISLEQALAIMKELRLDFAQQFPRGTSFKSEGADSVK